MSKKTIILVIVASVGILGIMAWGYRGTAGSSAAPSNAQSALKADTSLYDFGTISMAKGTVSHRFSVTNPTDKDIAVNNLQTSCMCTSAYFWDGSAKEGPFGMPGMGGMTKIDRVIKAHGSVDIEAVYDPAAHGPAGVGNIDRFISLTQADGGTLQMEIKATVTP